MTANRETKTPAAVTMQGFVAHGLRGEIGPSCVATGEKGTHIHRNRRGPGGPGTNPGRTFNAHEN